MYGYKKVRTKNVFPLLFFVLVGSGIRNKHLGYATRCISPILTSLTIITLTSTASFHCIEDATIEKPTTVNISFWIHRYPKIRTYRPGSS
jgi:hypothetical protein